MSIVKDGKVIFSRGYGVADMDTKEPVTEHTPFQIASISKSFAATLLVKLLYEETKLSVDSQVRKLMGKKFQMPDDFRTRETTFADLMGHRIGINGNNRIRLNSNLTRENLIEFISELKAPHQFRVKYFYSNLMYGLVTRIAEIIGGRSWEDLVQEHLYNPIGMGNSTFATTGNFTGSGVAQGYYEELSGRMVPVSHEFSRRWALLAGSGAIVSSASDMAKYMHFHLHGGKNPKGQQVMQEKHLKEVHKPRFLVTPTSSKDTMKPLFPVTAQEDLYAHGFRKGYYRGYDKLGHTGSTFGYRAMVNLLPGEKIGVFSVMTGRDDSYKYRVPLHFYLMDAALGVTPWLNTSTICSYPAPWKKPRKKSRAPRLDASVKLKRAVREYEGTYYNKAYGHIHVKYNKTLTTLVLTYGWGQWRLFSRPKRRGDQFYGKGMGLNHFWNMSPFIFIGDKKDTRRITTLKATGFESSLPPFFKKIIPGPSTTVKPSVKAPSAKMTSDKTLKNIIKSDKQSTVKTSPVTRKESAKVGASTTKPDKGSTKTATTPVTTTKTTPSTTTATTKTTSASKKSSKLTTESSTSSPPLSTSQKAPKMEKKKPMKEKGADIMDE